MPAVAPDLPHKSSRSSNPTFRRGMFITALSSGSAIVLVGLGVFDRVENEPMQSPSNVVHAPIPAQAGPATVIERVSISDSVAHDSEELVLDVSDAPKAMDDHAPNWRHSLLGSVLWDLEKEAGTVALVLAHPLFNPKEIELSAPARQELERLLDRIKKDVRAVERPMIDRRLEVLVDRWRQGSLAPAPRDANGETQPPASTDPEVETGLCGPSGSSFAFAIKWGDDVTLDRLRLAVYETKQRSVDSLVAFVASHAP